MNKRIPIILGLLLVIIAIWMLMTSERHIRSFIERLDNVGYDWQMIAHVMTHPDVPSSPVAIVDIDDRSLKEEGQWPWPRGKLATLVNELQAQGAIVIAFDIMFPEKQDNIAEVIKTELPEQNKSLAPILAGMEPAFDQDKKFAEALEKSQAVLAFSFLPRNEQHNLLNQPILLLDAEQAKELNFKRAIGYLSNIPVLQKAAKGSGFINVFADSDGIIRRVPLLIQYEDGLYPSLALQAVLTYLGEKVTLNTPLYHDERKLESIQIGSTTIPTDERGQVLIPFIGRSYTFVYYSATDVLHHKLHKDALLGKIIFVGTSATGLGDLQTTSIQSPFPGVEIQATLVNGLLEKSNFSFVPPWTLGAGIVLTLVFGLFATFYFPYRGPRILAILIVLFPPFMFFANNWYWEETGLTISVLVPVGVVQAIALMNMIYGYVFETRRREHLKTMFGQYVPEKHIDEMLHTSANYALRGEDREMSVLFADIRGFTSISEGLTASELVKLLNTYFNPMTEIIFKHHGTIDKYVGDLIMAFWGAPLKEKFHARHAMQTALEMQAKNIEMRQEFANKNWPEINIGIGIASGVMSVGDMGSRYRRNYTVLGDKVNLASRVESLTKFYGVDIIVTQDTQELQTHFVFRLLDKVRVKGKKLGVNIYELVGYSTQLTLPLREELAAHEAAIAAYFKQDWEHALKLFDALHREHPQTKIYSLYLARIEEFKRHPVAEDWDGVFEHLSK